MSGTTLKVAIEDDDGFIGALKVLGAFATKEDLGNKADIDGSNATADGVTAMLDKLTDTNKLLKVDASNLTDPTNQKAFADKILGAKDGKKSVLVQKLGEFLDNKTDRVYGSSQTAQDFLGDKKGMKGEKGNTSLEENVAAKLVQNIDKLNTLKAKITSDSTFQNALAEDGTLLEGLINRLASTQSFKDAIKMKAAISDTGFKEAVRAVESETHYDMPSNQNEPLSWHIPFSDSLLG